jgi:acyl carrier protein
MNELKARLAECFLTVFPELPAHEISGASTASVLGWDSVASVTLLAVIEEQFGISMEGEDLARRSSFKGILRYLQEAGTGK